MWISSVFFLFLIVPVLINVAFFTLLERKILGLAQSRKGPNKVSLGGMLQPIADAVKLFTKEVCQPFKGAHLLYLGAPGLALFLMLLCWIVTPSNFWASDTKFSVLLLLTVLSMNLYPLVLAGWASMSAYASIGAMRGVAQTLSYEISMALLLMSLFLGNYVLSWSGLEGVSPGYHWPGSFCPLIVAWLICCVAETNRTPFDFSEGESELVSGFNIEFGGGLFAMIFMAEYGMMLALSALTAMITTMFSLNNLTIFFTLGISFLWVWLRATLPRYRYDKLMKLAWTSLLPLALAALCFFTLI